MHEITVKKIPLSKAADTATTHAKITSYKPNPRELLSSSPVLLFESHPPPTSTLFPYTTLFRSCRHCGSPRPACGPGLNPRHPQAYRSGRAPLRYRSRDKIGRASCRERV